MGRHDGGNLKVVIFPQRGYAEGHHTMGTQERLTTNDFQFVLLTHFFLQRENFKHLPLLARKRTWVPHQGSKLSPPGEISLPSKHISI